MDIQGTSLILFIVSLTIAITIHEAMHAFAAHALGDSTAHDEGRLTLNPLAHIDIFATVLLPAVLILIGGPVILAAKPVPFNPENVKYGEFGAAIVGLVGPFTNLVLAVITAIALHFIQPDIGTLLRDGLLLFMQLNVGLFVFNMLPIPPLDGSRLLYALAPEPVQRAMWQMEQFGLVGIFLILYLLSPVIMPIINNLNNYFMSLLV